MTQRDKKILFYTSTFVILATQRDYKRIALTRIKNWLRYVVSVADPDQGSGIRCLFDPWIRNGKIRIRDPTTLYLVCTLFLVAFRRGWEVTARCPVCPHLYSEGAQVKIPNLKRVVIAYPDPGCSSYALILKGRKAQFNIIYYKKSSFDLFRIFSLDEHL